MNVASMIGINDAMNRMIVNPTLDIFAAESDELTGMLPSLCHNSLLSDATIPQRHYLIYWSEKVGVLQSMYTETQTHEVADILYNDSPLIASWLPKVCLKYRQVHFKSALFALVCVAIVTLIIEATGREFIIDVGQTAKRTQVNC